MSNPMQVSTKAESRAVSIEAWKDLALMFEDANIYQTAAYGSSRWGVGNLSHFILEQDGEFASAAQIRLVMTPYLKCGIAYLRWGPMCHRKGGMLKPAIVQETLRQLHMEYVAKRGLLLKILPNAFVGTARGEIFLNAFKQNGFTQDRSAESYRTFLVDLSPPLEIVRKGLAQKWRNQLNQAERNEVEVSIDTTDHSYGEFLKLYAEMRLRKQFETSVDPLEFDRIRRRLREVEKMPILIARKAGRPIGAVVISAIGNTAIYLLGATNESGRTLKAAYLLHWKAISWLKDKGVASYDLGGVDADENPGGYHFKAGLGRNELLQIAPQVASRGLMNLLILWILECRSLRCSVSGARDRARSRR